MFITFVSNYINHHQIPFCEAMIKVCGRDNTFTFIQTEKMEADRIAMGWGRDLPDYVRLAYESEEENKACRQLIFDSEVVIFGGCEDESYIAPRLEDIRHKCIADRKKGIDPEARPEKITFRYCERLYRTGQWKFVSPKGLRRKYLDHTRYNRCPVYLLCAGAYVASDFGIIRAYRNKMYKWGYFTTVKEYDIEKLISNKGWVLENGEKVPYILWAGRLLGLKHPELAVETARYLRDRDIEFHMDIVGDGPKGEEIKRLCDIYGLQENITFKDFMKPEEIRDCMEKADIYLFTSDRNEGWGAVVNEAMNSGCAVVAGNMIGSVPYLIRNGINGCVYDDKIHEELYEWVYRLIEEKNLRPIIGTKAYNTMKDTWNPKNAAERLWDLISEKMGDPKLADRNSELLEPCTREYPRTEAEIREDILGSIKPIALGD